MLAVRNRQVAVVRHLLSLPAVVQEVDRCNAFGYTALMLAVADGSTELAYQLLNAGANIK